MEDSQAGTNKLRKFIPTPFTSFWFKNRMASKIKDITERLQRINVWQAQTLNLRRIANGTRSNQLKERPPTTSLVVESHIYGRNDDKEAIVEMLLKTEEGGNNFISVIPILGMGGIGKTTLAKLVYNDSKVQDYFDIKTWVCVSENFYVIDLTRTILRYVDPEIRDLKYLDLNSLQQTLKEKLSQKKFLLILDDVWEEDYNQWDLLRAPFVSAATSSKIVVTSRKENAAPIAGDVHAYRVKKLPDEECLILLAHHALAAQNFDAQIDLRDIGLELAKRCDGLPLAAKVLGGLLRNKRSREEWERVLRSKLWNSGETSYIVNPTLKLSYNDLPSHLKRCFVYCAIFPKDYEFERDELILLWMAEGFLPHSQGGKLMEDLGIDYFEDLVSRSLFQLAVVPYSRPRPIFVMHDLISDLAQNIAKEICYNNEAMLKDDMSSLPYHKVRHASFSYIKDIDSQEYEIYTRMKRLRTIVGIPICRRDEFRPGFCEYKMLYKLLAQSKCTRVLSLTISEITELPNSIGDLFHLRYINLAGTMIQKLPESVSKLLNLQTLLLCRCYMLEKLPDKMRNLVKLRHLDISYTSKLQKLPSGVGMLTNLQTLSKFIVNEGHGTTIAELKNLSNLRGSLSIEGLQNVQDAKLANLKGKQGLGELKLKWNGQGKNDMSVLESLEPHQNLKTLTISCYDGAEFPSWMTSIRLVSLNLRDCRETKVLPPLGQLCLLKELSIHGLGAVKTIGVEFYGNVDVSFPSLERLAISDMSEWIEWSDGSTGGEGFPNLQELNLSNCPKLIGSLPSGLHRLGHLSELKIKGCGSLVSFAPMGLPCSLKSIYVIDCDNLLSLPDGLMVQDYNTRQFESESHLEHLIIVGCKRLTSLPPGKFPAALTGLSIGGPICMRLESAIFEKNTTLQGIEILDNDDIKALPFLDCFPSLRSLIISRCPALESFHTMDFLSTSLKYLQIEECQNLSWLPIRMQSHFPSLQQLNIRRCPNVGSLIEDGGLPRNLTTLEMEFCENLRPPIPISEWGLAMLSSLNTLGVYGRCPATADVVSFPDDNCSWLPNSLTHLRISDFVSLESVSMGLQMLTSLNYLRIVGCPKLRSLPKEALPCSLRDIYISGCPLLKKIKLLNGTKGLRVSYRD